MDVHELAETYDRIASAKSEPRRREILVDLFRSLDSRTLEAVAHFTLGEVVDPTQTEKLGIGPGTVRDVIAARSGRTSEQIERELRTGDIAELAASVAGEKGGLTVAGLWKRIARAIERNERRDRLIDEILESTTSRGADYFIRMILNRMRIGAGLGTMLRALAAAFDVDARELERLYAMTNDIGLTAVSARKGKKGLARSGLTIFHPYQFMNARRVESAPEIFERFGDGPAFFEVKYDGARLQVHIHRTGPKSIDVKLYSRRLNDVTDALPDVVAALGKAWKGKDAILEGEAVAYDRTLAEKQPFQIVLTRLGRKIDVEAKAKEFPFILYLFDILYDDGADLMELPMRERRKRLARHLRDSDRVALTSIEETDDVKRTLAFFTSAIAEGHEGLMAKDPDGIYIPGRRTELWLKLKPTYETLDVVIVGGIWGTGRRRGLLSSLLVAVRDEASNTLKTVGKVAAGFSEEALRDLTARLERLIVAEHGRTVEVEPQIVIEVDFQDIQKTSAYDSGYALRIPRFRRERPDKSVKEADTVERMERRNSQFVSNTSFLTGRHGH